MSTTRVVILDAQRKEARYSLTDSDWRPHVPTGSRALTPLRLSDFGAPDVVRTGAGARPVDWAGLAAAMARLSEASRSTDGDSDPPTHTLVVGQAPLPVFALAGYEFGSWTGSIFLLNRRRDGTWDRLPMRSSEWVETLPFEVATPIPREASDARGIVAVAVSTLHPVDPECVETYCRSQGAGLAALIELRGAERGIVLNASMAPGALIQLRETFDKIQRRFPRRHSIALIVSGRATLAFMAAHAINPNVVGRVHVPNYVPSHDEQPNAYEHAFTLQPGVVRGGSPVTPPPALREPGATGSPGYAKLLFVSSHTQDDEVVQSGREVLLVNEALAVGAEREAFKMVSRATLSASALQHALNHEQPVILHFSGHGSDANSFAGILLCGDRQDPHPVAGGTLIPLFQSLPRRVRLVVLNGCETAAAAQALTGAVDAALGWHGRIGEAEALALAGGLYRALAAGLALSQAFEQARFQLRAELPRTRAVPELFVAPEMRSQDLLLARA